MLRFILDCANQVKFWISLMLISEFQYAADRSLRPYLIKLIVDKATRSEPYSTLWGPAFALITLFWLRCVTISFFTLGWAHTNTNLKRYIGIKLMGKTMQHSHVFFQDKLVGSMATKIKDAMSFTPDFIRMLLFNGFGHGLGILIAAGTFFTIGKEFLLLFLGWVSITSLVTFFISKKGYVLSLFSAEIRAYVIGIISDILSNINVVRLFARHKKEKEYLKEGLDQYVEADLKRDYTFIGLYSFQYISYAIYQTLSIVCLIYGYQSGRVTPGDFALIFMINISMSEVLRELLKDLGKYAELLGSIQQGLNLAFSKKQVVDAENATKLNITDGAISFDHVSFCYPDSDMLIENLSIQIHPKEKVGLVGYSGAGKTTFVNLILRLFDVDTGLITIDGQNIKDVTQESLHKNIAVIPQDASLFHRTLLENIRYGNPEAKDLDVLEASKRAFVHDFVEQLPEKYDTLVGERGIKLSGGQRQRIAIARAILKNAPILILDEATSQLDSISEQKIQESINNLMQNKTTIIIAHRLSTLLHMDRILVFEGGRIVQDGSHEDLIKEPGLYKTMWDTQVGGFLPNY